MIMRQGFQRPRQILQVNEENRPRSNKTYINFIYAVKNFELFLIFLHFLDLETTLSDHETRLTAAEENIQGRVLS